MNSKQKLMLIQDIVNSLEKSGVTLTPNAVRARIKNTMFRLAEESCKAMGIDMDNEQLQRIAASRAFQEALASVLIGEDI
jgi:hypothetical protein